jgi:hypothetical protein
MHLLCRTCSVVQEVTSESDAVCSSCGSALPVHASRSKLPGDQWSVLMHGRQVGPYSAEAFARGLEQQQLTWTMLVWRQGLRSWRPARRDELLVMAVAGKLGLGGETARLDGLDELMQTETLQEAPSEWLIDDQPQPPDLALSAPRPLQPSAASSETRVESWPAAMQRAPDRPASEPSSSESQRRAPRLDQPTPDSAGLDASVESRVSLPPPLPPQVRPIPPAARTTASRELDESSGGFLLSATYAPHERSAAAGARADSGGTGALWIAALAFAAGALLAVVVVRMNGVSLDRWSGFAVGPTEVVSLSDGALNAPSAASAGKQAQVALVAPGARTEPAAPAPVSEPPPAQLHAAAEGAPPTSAAAPSETSSPTPSPSDETEPRSSPAIDEVRAELQRLSPALRRCTRTPGLAMRVRLDGPSGRVRDFRVTAPALGPGSLECLKEGLTELQVAPFEQQEFALEHRFSALPQEGASPRASW